MTGIIINTAGAPITATETPSLQPGMVVAPIERPHGTAWLRSGAEAYPGAVVVSINPFVLVSVDGDMMWHSHQAEDFYQVGYATAEMTKAVKARLQRESEQRVKEEAEDLIMRALQAGVILTIDLVPNTPLAMGNYTQRVDVRQAKGA
jgi:hypothetical protein